MPTAVISGAREPPSPGKILIIRTSALGDVVQTLPALEALRQLFPAAKIHWLVEPLSADLLAGHPHIDRLHVMDRKRWKQELRHPGDWLSIAAEAWKLGRELRRERFDVVIDFQGNVRSAILLLIAGGRLRFGFHRADVSELGASWISNRKAPRLPPRTRKVDKYLMLVRALGHRGAIPAGIVPVADEARAWARSYLATLTGCGPAVVLHPGVSRFGAIKRWPAARFRRLIDLLREGLDARVAVTWGPGERELAAEVGRPTLFPELLPLGRLAAVCREADLVVAADTGVLHMAAMLGTPTVGIYGPKDAAVYGPAPGRGDIVSSSAPCSPCKLRQCEHRICMDLITPESVFACARRHLQPAAAAAAPP